MPGKDHLRASATLESKMREKRRGPRVNSRVPLAVEWSDPLEGENRQEQAHTRVVNFHGCLLVSPQAIPLEQRLRVTNLATCQSISAVVVYQGHQRADGWELGVELVHPQMDFWGLEL